VRGETCPVGSVHWAVSVLSVSSYGSCGVKQPPARMSLFAYHAFSILLRIVRGETEKDSTAILPG